MLAQPLSGITIIDLTHHVAGPFCTKLLGGMGAEVIKIERPGQGDPARRMGPFPEDKPDPEKSGTFLYMNTGKKSISLNLKTATGVNIFKRLVKKADVVVENFEPRVMQSLCLSYETLEELNPRLVMTSISNFGQSGPYRDYRAEEIVSFAMGGLMYLLGDPEREPVKLGYASSQYMAGLAGFTGTMAALHYTEETGIGQQVDISIMECIAASHPQSMVEYAYTGSVTNRNRTMLGFPCKDGIVQTTMQPHMWPRLTQLVGMPRLLEDPRFKTTEDRRMHAEELETILLPWMMERTMDEIYHAGQVVRLPIGYPASSKDLFNSPQYRAREFFVDIDHPRTGILTYPGAPLKMGDLPWQHGRAPLFGEHNSEIYCGRLGYSKGDLVMLRQKGII